MKGIVVIPNDGTPNAVIQRSDGLLMVVEPLNKCRLALMDSVEIGDIKGGFEMEIKNLTTECKLIVVVKKINFDLSWEEKMNLLGKKVR
jgi:hypothetical protein